MWPTPSVRCCPPLDQSRAPDGPPRLQRPRHEHALLDSKSKKLSSLVICCIAAIAIAVAIALAIAARRPVRLRLPVPLRILVARA